jgi:hypothetical protein
VATSSVTPTLLGNWTTTALAILALLGMPQVAGAQDVNPDTVCTDAVAAGGYHEYTTTTSPFRKIFNLHLSALVDHATTGWSADSVDAFTRAIHDSAAAGGPQLFKKIWDFYCYTDSAAGADTISFKQVVGFNQTATFNKIDAHVYHSADFSSGYEAACNGYFRPGTGIIAVAAACGNSSLPPKNPFRVARELGFAHELAHLCDYANKAALAKVQANVMNSEALSTGAEYVGGARWRNYGLRSPEYDVSLMYGNSNNFAPPGGAVLFPYDHWRLFNAYLFTHLTGYTSADSSTLVYKWIRQNTPTVGERTGFVGLGTTLMQGPFASQIPGSRAAEKLGNLMHRFAIARYLNNSSYAGGIYGFGTEVSTTYFRLFNWIDQAFARVRTLPPLRKLGAPHGDGLPDTLSKLIDPVDPIPSTAQNKKHLTECCYQGQYYEPVRIVMSGSDYFIFSADSTYFATNHDRELSIRVRGTEAVPFYSSGGIYLRTGFRLGYVTYDSYDSVLVGKTILSSTETVPITYVASGDTLDTSFTIPRFGKTNKGVLVVFTMVPDSLTVYTNFGNQNGFGLDYDMNYVLIHEFKGTYWDGPTVSGTYGTEESPILLSANSEVASGASLALNPGTVIRVDKNSSTPLAMTVKGTLTANGVTFTSNAASPAKGDWAGIVVSNSNGTVDLDNCTISYADVGIQLGTGPTGGSGGGGTLDGCNFSNNSDEDIWIDGHATVTVTGGVITTSSTSNHVGIHIDDAVGTVTIRGVEIIGTSAAGAVGILCEDAASLLGNHVHGFSSSTGAGVRFDLSDTTLVPLLDNYSSTVSQLMDNYKAIDVASAARPKIRRARIDNSTYGIYVGTNALPDVGTSSDQGGCDITDSSSKHIACKTPRLSSLPNVQALYNWWGSATSGDFSGKLSPFVDWNPFLGSDPYGSLSARLIETEDVPGSPKVHQNAPNPFSQETTFRVTVPSNGTKISLRVYDVHGRVVRDLADQTAEIGEYMFQWDGTDSEGRALPSGVYYYRAKIGAFEKTMKLLRIR